MKKIIFTLIIWSIISSCEKGTTFKYEVENNSSKTIVFKIEDNFHGSLDSAVILAGGSKTVLFIDQQGLFDDDFQCGQFLDSGLRTKSRTNFLRPMPLDLLY